MTAQIILGLFGASGFGREVMPFAREVARTKFGKEGAVETVFIETHPKTKRVNDIAVLSEEEFFRLACKQKYFNVAIADAKVREAVARRCAAAGAKPLELIGPSTHVFDGNQIAEGMILCPFSMVTSNIKIGKFFHSNIYSYIGHDCVIGDYVTFAPRVNCNGNVHIGNHAYIGTSAVIRQGTPDTPLTIGEGAIIGMGAVVTKNVPPGVTVIGNPARPLEKKG